jgi:hypothetical protein
MIESKKLLITFDYELFLGKNSGTVENCILKPTSRVLKVLNRFDIRGVFFIDTAYLVRLREKAAQFPGAAGDYGKIMEQLTTLIKDGHYLFPHIHAHWANAIYNESNNSWHLRDLSKYRFHNLDTAGREQVFGDAMNFLQELILPVKPDYQIDSYRAGGWCIQPFSDFKPYFEKYGISNDFSVMPGTRSVSTMNYFDFANAKTQIYPFKNEVLKDEEGPFCEFPVSTMHIDPFSRFIHRVESKVLWKLGMKNTGDGNAAQFTDKPFIYPQQAMSIDNLLYTKMSRYKAYIEQNDYIHIVSHPKMLSRYNIGLFESLLKHTAGKYSILSDYKKMKPNYANQNSNTHRHSPQFH